MTNGGNPQFEMRVSEAIEGGTYSNLLSVWHTPYEFTLDFAVIQPADTTGGQPIVPCRVVARIKVPPTLLFDILQALNENMTMYENVFGDIQRPTANPPQPGPSGEDESQ
jgi:hypothetical protein